jgi:hypothetical protein
MTLAAIPGLGSEGPTELIILLTIFRRGTSGEAEMDEVRDREEEGKELSRGTANNNEKVRLGDDDARAKQVGQKH